MPRGRGHRAGLEEIGQELNLIPYLDVMVNLVLFLLVSITSFLSFTVLTASIPQLATDSGKAMEAAQKAQLLLMVRVTRDGFRIDPNVQGGAEIKPSSIRRSGEKLDFAALTSVVQDLKAKFPNETRVLILSEPKIAYDEVIKTMDSLREKEKGKDDLFPDVTLSIL